MDSVIGTERAKLAAQAGTADAGSVQSSEPRHVSGIAKRITRTVGDAKLDALELLSAFAAHDLNNQLMVIRGSSELIDPTLDDAPDLLKTIIAAVDRATRLTERLMSLSAGGARPAATVDLDRLMMRLARQIEPFLGSSIAFDCRPDVDVWDVDVDEGRLIDTLLNLVTNARDAMPSGGHLSITADNVRIDADQAPFDAEPGDYARICLADTGIGMDAATLAHIFEPYFTTKAGAAGTGLGLASALQFAKRSGGFIAVSSRPGRGTTFELFLPRSEKQRGLKA